MDVELVDFRVRDIVLWTRDFWIFKYTKSVQKEQEEITNVVNQAREIIATQKSMEAMKKSELSRLAPAIAKLEFELSKAETEDSAPAISQDSVPLEDPPVNLPMGVRRKEDYTNGYADGYKSGYITGYSRGYADGRVLQMTTLRKNLEEKKAQKASLLKEVEEIRHTLPQHQAELEENEQKRAKLNQEARSEEQRKTNEINELDKFRMELLKIDSRLGILKDNFDLIDSLKRKIEQLNESMQTLQNKKAMLERRMTSISSKQHEKRVLEDQLKKMEITQKLAVLEPELAKISAQFQSCEDLRKKEQSLNKQCLDLEHAVHRMSGEQGELSKRVDEIRRKLSEARYRDAQKAYRDKFIEKVCRMKSIDVCFFI
uniref:Uncharacterized protein n=1 Tax=Acrobeloides nanus TaxID=290746 RepID=A0A914CZK8_9BILA